MSSLLLVVPPHPRTRDVKQMEGVFPRLGLACVAAAARDAGHGVAVLDCRAHDLRGDAGRDEVRRTRPDVVGLGPFTEELYEALDVARAAREALPDARIVFGGPHATAIPERTLAECEAVDLVVRGEGEGPLVRLLDGEAPADVEGVAWRDGDDVVVNAPAPPTEDLDALPRPAWDLLPLPSYRGLHSLSMYSPGGDPVLELPVLSSRGCAHACAFCYRTMPGLRLRDPAAVADEIAEGVHRYGATLFFFADGTFLANHPHGQQVCEQLIARGLHRTIRWIAETRVDAVDGPSLALMKRAGCHGVFFGVEAGDPEMLRHSRKGITPEQVVEAVRLSREAGLVVDCYTIIGHPFETTASVARTEGLMHEVDPDLLNMAIMLPFPGTEVRRMAELGEGDYRLLSDDWSQYTKQRGGPLELGSLPLAALRRLQSRAYLRFYLRPRKLGFVLRHLSPRKAAAISASLARTALSGG